MEEGDRLSGSAITTAARIAGIARRDQILCSSLLVGILPKQTVIAADAMPDLGAVQEDAVSLSLFQIHWPSYQEVAIRSCPA